MVLQLHRLCTAKQDVNLIINSEHMRLWEVMVMAYSPVLPQHSETEKCHDKSVRIASSLKDI
jgi:hypothetical protein